MCNKRGNNKIIINISNHILGFDFIYNIYLMTKVVMPASSRDMNLANTAATS